jgi:DNA invertase Pin-like site-specific DNA recombinase
MIRSGHRLCGRVSTTKKDLDRQILAHEAAGITPERIYVDKKSGATTNRSGLQCSENGPPP